MKPARMWLGALALAAAACGGGGSNRDPQAMTRHIEEQSRAAYPALPGADESATLRERGRGIFKAAGCELCHSTSRERKGMSGPPLGGLAEVMPGRHDNDALEARRWLYRHIRDPQRFAGPHAGTPEYRGAFMPPNTRLNDDEMRALIEFLWHLP
jgi:cytochrome c551/c552